jgi:UPF0716 protein FxsA
VFLILPGFLGDAIGILLFIPPLRHLAGRMLWTWVQGSERVRVYAARNAWPSGPGAASGRATVIEGEFREVDGSDRPSEPGRQDPDQPRLH